jgi:septal ring factor EnvC (AmiA/AmiB activator)
MATTGERSNPKSREGTPDELKKCSKINRKATALQGKIEQIDKTVTAISDDVARLGVLLGDLTERISSLERASVLVMKDRDAINDEIDLICGLARDIADEVTATWEEA